MSNGTDDQSLDDLRELAEAAEALARDPEAFKRAHDAFVARDASAFQAALEAVDLFDRCELICRFLCRKHCVGICLRFCPEPRPERVDVEEMIAFAHAMASLAKQPESVRRLQDIVASGDEKAWAEALRQLELERFCHQLCHFLCSVRCRLVCRELCPPRPLITRVGDIPISQINPQGFGSGPSVGPGHTPAPNPGGGVGDHPFGDYAELRGIFNMPTATQYLVEVSSTGPGGSYTPFVGSTSGYNNISVFPWQVPCSRSTSTGVDPGWFDVAQICDSDGGPNAIGEKMLVHWPTPPTDGLYHLRLRVRDGTSTRVSAPQPVTIDNSGPFPLPRPTITLELQKEDGSVEELRCSTVERGQGLIRVTVHAYDPNLSGVSVTARGNSGLSVPVQGVPLAMWPGGPTVPLSKTYGGNLAEQGYPVPTSFVWDPWSDPQIVPCCYLVYIEINDRTIRNDAYTGGHYNAGWEAIEIAI